MSLSRSDVRRLRSAGWEIVETGPRVRIRRTLWWLATGRRRAPGVRVVRAHRVWLR
jgi:hypothetical protein